MLAFEMRSSLFIIWLYSLFDIMHGQSSIKIFLRNKLSDLLRKAFEIDFFS